VVSTIWPQVKPYTPTHDLIIGSRTRVDYLPCPPNAFAPLLTKLRVRGLVGLPLGRLFFDICVDIVRRSLILVVFSGQLIGFEGHAVTAIIDVAGSSFAPYVLTIVEPPDGHFRPSALWSDGAYEGFGGSRAWTVAVAWRATLRRATAHRLGVTSAALQPPAKHSACRGVQNARTPEDNLLSPGVRIAKQRALRRPQLNVPIGSHTGCRV
jgi:hypothetical protein